MKRLEFAGGIVATTAITLGITGCTSGGKSLDHIAQPVAVETSALPWFDMDQQHELSGRVTEIAADDELTYIERLPSYDTSPTESIHTVLLSLEPKSKQQCIGEFAVTAMYRKDPTNWIFRIGLHGDRQDFAPENTYNGTLGHGEGIPETLTNGVKIDTEQTERNTEEIQAYAKDVLRLLCR